MFKNRKIRNILSFLKQIYIYLILFAIYLPLVIIILLSFNNPTARGNIDFNFGTPTFVNYFDLFQESEFVNALLNSLLVVAIVTPITILIAVLTCFGI
jgi:spermidine/putrescine transport system permease protein